jgi:hypothetical protein
MAAQIGRFSGVALIRVLAERGSRAVCDCLLFGIISQKRTSARSHRSSTVVALHARESRMARSKLTVDRDEEIKRRLADGRSLRETATASGCSQRLVRQIGDGERLTHETAASPDPLWMAQLE